MPTVFKVGVFTLGVRATQKAIGLVHSVVIVLSLGYCLSQSPAPTLC